MSAMQLVVEITFPGRKPYGVGPLMYPQGELVMKRFAQQYPKASTRLVPASDYPELGTKVDLRRTA